MRRGWHRDELGPEEYEETKNQSKEQLLEYQNTLGKLSTGDMTLVDELSSLRLALQAAISEAFKTPEVISLFAKKQPAQLRLRLNELERDHKIQRISEPLFVEQKCEILSALRKLNDPLSPDEQSFLTLHSTEALANFEAAGVSDFAASSKDLLKMVGDSIKS